MDNKELFDYWVGERERVRQRKEQSLPKPWSDDPVFHRTYFCNIDREQDKVTKWIRERYLYLDGPALPNMIMARFVNKPESLEEMLWPWDEWEPDVWSTTMSQPGTWGSAYIVSTNGNPLPKHQYIAGLLERAFERFKYGVGTGVAPTLSGWHTTIQTLPGMGSFMAAQVVADLKNTKHHPLSDAEDWHTFAAHGPGSLRGLSWFHDEPIKPRTFMEALVSARQWVHNNGRHSQLVSELCNQNLQNCFCEYDKYMRVLNNTGRSKRKYDGV